MVNFVLDALLVCCAAVSVSSQAMPTYVIQLQLREGSNTSLSSHGVVKSSTTKDPSAGSLKMTADNMINWEMYGWYAEKRKSGDPMAVGEIVRFRLNATENVRSKIRIGLCGFQCSVVTSWGLSKGTPSKEPELGNIVWISRSDNIDDNLHSTDLKQYTGSWSWSGPYITFGIERQSEHKMLLWGEVDGRKSNVVEVPLTADRDRLTVSSFAGSFAFLAEDGENSKVLTRRNAPGLLIGPFTKSSLVMNYWACLEVEHRTLIKPPPRDSGLLLSTIDVHGVLRLLAKLEPNETGEWTNSRVFIAIPSEPTKLVISASTSVQLQSTSTCEFEHDDSIDVGELKGEYKLPQIPGNLSFFIRDSNKRGPSENGDALEPCLNGGEMVESRDDCVCQAGFKGKTCGEACLPGFVGASCDVMCESRDGVSCEANPQAPFCLSQCWGNVVCNTEFCQCAPGFKGDRCEQVCDAGEYGPGCILSCGRCSGQSVCNPFGGQCPQGCLDGFVGPNCKEELVHMVQPPKVTGTGRDYVEGTVTLVKNSTAGMGKVSLVEVQYRIDVPDVPETSSWHSTGMTQLQFPWSRDPESTPRSIVPTRNVLRWRVDGLMEGTEISVRCVLRDAELRALDHEQLPVTRAVAKTNSSSVRQSSQVVSVRRALQTVSKEPWTLVVTWNTLFGESNGTPYTLTYECEKLLACAADCSRSSGLVDVAQGPPITLQGLNPGARYRIKLTQGLKEKLQRGEAPIWEEHHATTRFAPPSSVAVRGRVVSVGTDFATLQWEDADSCALDNGPRSGFHWELSDGRAGNTGTATLHLRDLQAATEYQLTVYTSGVDGWQRKPPRGALIVKFTTLAKWW